MTQTAVIKDQELLILPKAGGGAVLWYGTHRIEVTRTELNALASALADAATPLQAVA